MKYRTLDGEVFDLSRLPASHRIVYSEAKELFRQKTSFWEFSNFWIGKIKELGIEDPEEPLFKICQDLESRLSIQQGVARMPTWRYLLAELIQKRFRSKYAFCQAVGMDQGYLSQVLSGKKNLSMPKLISILGKIGHIIILVPADPFVSGEEE